MTGPASLRADKRQATAAVEAATALRSPWAELTLRFCQSLCGTVGRYGTVGGPPHGAVATPTFDFVDVQLYEGFSRAAAAVNGGEAPAAYIARWARAMQTGWEVDFGSDPTSGVPTQIVRVPAPRLVVGFSHGSEKLPSKIMCTEW